MKFAIASVALLLGACSPSEGPPEGTPGPASPPSGQVQLPAPMNDGVAPASSAPRALRVVGTEPFWGVELDGDALTFTTPDDQAGAQMRGVRTETPGGGIDVSGQRGGTAFLLKVRPGDCSDGMSDMTYAMTAELQLGEVEYRGCARSAEQ